MGSFINITSEIGKLNTVMLHRPGKEIENLVPEYLGRLLFDDIPYLEVAKKEHDKFADILRRNDVKVLYLEDLASEALIDMKVREDFLKRFLEESNITNSILFEGLNNYLLSLPINKMVDEVISGIRKNELKIEGTHSLAVLMNDVYPFYLDPMPNLYFTRDPCAAIGNGLTINTMQTEARRRESLFLEYIHGNHRYFKDSETPLWYDRSLSNNIEGGDEAILSGKVIAIGCSQRTSPEAIEVVAKNLFEKHTSFEKVLVFQIPACRAFMHLDTVFTMVDYDKFTIHPGIEESLNVFEITKGANGGLNIKQDSDKLENILKNALSLPAVKLIRCGGGDFITAGREQWNDGANTLAIAPGKIITYERNYVTNEILDANGITVLTMPSSELSRGRGGPGCMSMPLNRNNL
ncbi:arginine deiminase [Clostridium sp.]|uniref:arginine deiminase n=1 Tax=Clostridium sp. TaxID=1506 RepID=UPI001A4A5460|nr:arginine deiminase [Clostridium sp.]MBK5236528.1 arginine deiminase [Clostridium sp.]